MKFSGDYVDVIRRIKRSLDSKLSYRKALILFTLCFAFLLYFGPSVYRLLFPHTRHSADPVARCLEQKIDGTMFDAFRNADAVIQHVPLREDEPSWPLFMGNGWVGMLAEPGSPIYLKHGRTLSLPVPFHPIVSVLLGELDEKHYQTASVLHLTHGIVQRFHCAAYQNTPLEITEQYYAHRTLPFLLVQEITITNEGAEDVTLDLKRRGVGAWPLASSRTTTLRHDHDHKEFVVVTGLVDIPKSYPMQRVAVSIVSTTIPKNIEVKAKATISLKVLTAVAYSRVMTERSDYDHESSEIELRALGYMKEAGRVNSRKLKYEHTQVWQYLWSSGMGISPSKALDAVNGDRINATLYYTLSQVRALLHEKSALGTNKEELNSFLAYTEGCYGGHHTLQAVNLWADLQTVEDLQRVTSLWLMTLEKNGCHNLLRTGADGVMQAMVLSLGALKFSNQHLEFNMQPKDLHRDFHFRRLNYGNATHVNISVFVQDDNRAAIYVALDRSDKNYYACDGGCLDAPVQLGPSKLQFPVKLTDPPTAVLYITSDKQHMEELKHTIHVKEVAEAPAHEHHVIALHRHGHHLGAIPTFFWASICLLIIAFHLFLFKLIYNEYCSNAAGGSSRMRKFSDF